MFRDHRTAGAWLPKTMYTTRFQESGYRALAEFDGDVDLTTGSAAGVTLAGEHLSTWNENAVPFRGRGTDTQNHNAVWIGWSNKMAPGAAGRAAGAADEARCGAKPTTPAGKDEPLGPPASYSIAVPEALRSAWGVSDRSAVYLSVAATNTTPGPRTPPKDPKDEKTEEETKAAAKKPAPKPPPKPKTPPPTTEGKRETGRDADRLHRRSRGRGRSGGAAAAQPVRHRAPAARHASSTGAPAATRQRFTTTFELIPQTFVLPARGVRPRAAGVRPAPARDDPPAVRSHRRRHDRRPARRPLDARPCVPGVAGAVTARTTPGVVSPC